MKKIYCTAFVALTSLIGCYPQQEASSSTTSRYSDSIKNLYGVNSIEWIEILNQEPNYYLAYVYSPTCYYCNLVRNEINLLANCSDIDLFFITFNDKIPVSTNPYNTIGVASIDNLYVVGTPTLFVIEDSAINDCYLGYKSISNYVSLLLDID